MKKYPYVLFDLDGTILDTNELILSSFMHTLEINQPGKYTRQDVIEQMGGPLVEMLRKFDPDNAEELVSVYRQYNWDHHDRLVTIFPYVQEVLQTIKDEGFKTALVTTKQRTSAIHGMELYKIDQYLDYVVGLEDTANHKPSPEPLLLAMENIGARPEGTIMVGDNPVDILGAKNAGVASCGVAWSMRGPDYLLQYEPDYIINDMRELLDIIRHGEFRA